ncbi:hypothetical protein QFC22_000974 [Naganishia vaughanmartiniae]|uniref:Uncharacterized protein n=1 Tax=Naganishia vaughanmartiniae TaxID=1424756 RepID=A0ACC2XJP0_9TREE|nr:hypothetical protein QFC22_000974 [Naganishia vaughanmartiniae]
METAQLPTRNMNRSTEDAGHAGKAPSSRRTAKAEGSTSKNAQEPTTGEAQNSTDGPKRRTKNKRAPRPQTFQFGPLDPLPTGVQSPQDVVAAAQRAKGEARRYKPSKPREPTALSPSAERGFDGLRIAEDVGLPILPNGNQPFDAKATVAALARNPEYLAGVHGATTDRRPHYLRAQNIRESEAKKPLRPPVHFGNQPGPTIPNRNHGRHPPVHLGNQLGPTIADRENWRRPPASSLDQSHIQQSRAHQANQSRGNLYQPNTPRFGINVTHVAGTKFERHDHNLRQVMAILERVPNPWPEGTKPYPSPYYYSLTHTDPRSNIPNDIFALAQQSPLSLAIIESWKASEPSQANKEAVVRIVNQVNAVLKERYGNRWNFVVEPFGSVSWGGETGDTADVDLTLRDLDRPYGYTKELWPKEGRTLPELGGVYNVHALSRCLSEAGYVNVEPIRWANTPIVKFQDPTSGVSLDLNTNDLGGSANSAMIFAYCYYAPFTLRPLIHIVKTWAKARNLNDPSGATGAPTLSSYCWTLMCIAYLQFTGKLPNLQGEASVKHFGREKCVIWVSWGRPRGQAANIGYADYVPGQTSADTHPEKIDEIVKGFFAFYYNMLRKDGVPSKGHIKTHKGRQPDSHRHVISVWKGGLTERSIPIKGDNLVNDMQVDVEGDEAVQDMAEVADEDGNGGVTTPASTSGGPTRASTNDPQRKPRGKRVRKFESAEDIIRGPAVDGFAQPENWAKRDLVVQDPFLHDKNCANALSTANYERVTQELCRANELFAQNAPLATLLEQADPLESSADRREEKKRLRKENRSLKRKPRSAAARAAQEEAEYKPECGDEMV